MHKKIYFWIALFWTLVVSFLCLTSSGNIPKIGILYLDKLIHVFFHFIFTVLWILFFKVQIERSNKWKPFLISFVLSFIFGITIEVCQELFTTTRSADVFDVLANVTGAILATVVMIFYYKKIKKNFI